MLQGIQTMSKHVTMFRKYAFTYLLDTQMCYLCYRYLFFLQFPEHGFYGLQNRILLFKHDQSDGNILKLINTATDVSEGTLIEVVLSGKTVFSLQPDLHVTKLFQIVNKADITKGHIDIYISSQNS